MDENFKNALERILDQKFAEQDKKFEEKFIRLFNQGFEEVAVPFIEGVEEGLKAGQNRIERKLDKFATDSIEHGITLKQHGVRISKLEQKIAA